MIVYHGSIEIVEIPLISKGRRNLDFGQGFYVTDIMQQAIDWATRPINHDKLQYLNRYILDVEAVRSANYRCIKFEAYDDRWLDFVLANRHGEQTEVFDMVEGGIANDRVFNTIELYDAKLITREEALSRLRYENPNNQICILSQEIINRFLRFTDAQLLNKDGK